jgi:hypothetical protein
VLLALWERCKAPFALRDRALVEWPPTPIAACAAPTRDPSQSCFHNKMSRSLISDHDVFFVPLREPLFAFLQAAIFFHINRAIFSSDVSYTA